MTHQNLAQLEAATAKNEKPRMSGALVQPVARLRRHRRAASLDEWHSTSPDLRRQGLAATALAGDIRTLARNFALCNPGTWIAALRISGFFLRQPEDAVNAVFAQQRTTFHSTGKTSA